MKIFKRKPIRKITDAIWILYFVNKFISISPYEHDKTGHKLTWRGIVKCALTFIMYSCTTYLAFELFHGTVYKKSRSLVTIVGNIIETITGIDTMVVLFIFSVTRSKYNFGCWEILEKIDDGLRDIGMPVTYDKFMAFSLRVAIITLGSLGVLQWNRSYTEAYFYGFLGFVYGMHNTMPLIVTFAIILQFQCLLYLFRERLQIIDKYFQQIHHYKSVVIRNPHVVCVKLGGDTKTSNPKNNKNKMKNCERQMVNKYLIQKHKSVEIQNSINRFHAVLKIWSDLVEWAENIQEAYSVPVLVSLILLVFLDYIWESGILIKSKTGILWHIMFISRQQVFKQ